MLNQRHVGFLAKKGVGLSGDGDVLREKGQLSTAPALTLWVVFGNARWQFSQAILFQSIYAAGQTEY